MNDNKARKQLKEPTTDQKCMEIPKDSKQMGSGWEKAAEEASAQNIRGEGALPKEASEKSQAGSEQTWEAEVGQRTRTRSLMHKQHWEQGGQWPPPTPQASASG